MLVKCKTKGIFTLQFNLFVVQELGEAEDLEKQKKIFNGYIKYKTRRGVRYLREQNGG